MHRKNKQKVSALTRAKCEKVVLGGRDSRRDCLWIILDFSNDILGFRVNVEGVVALVRQHASHHSIGFCLMALTVYRRIFSTYQLFSVPFETKWRVCLWITRAEQRVNYHTHATPKKAKNYFFRLVDYFRTFTSLSVHASPPQAGITEHQAPESAQWASGQSMDISTPGGVWYIISSQHIWRVEPWDWGYEPILRVPEQWLSYRYRPYSSSPPLEKVIHLKFVFFFLLRAGGGGGERRVEGGWKAGRGFGPLIRLFHPDSLRPSLSQESVNFE